MNDWPTEIRTVPSATIPWTMTFALNTYSNPKEVGFAICEELTNNYRSSLVGMNELIQELNRMPMTTETLRLRSRKREIEKELQQIETDIRLYSKPKVYLPIPSKKSPANYECLSSYCPESN